MSGMIVILCLFLLLAVIVIVSFNKIIQILQKTAERSFKFGQYFKLLDKWLELKEQNRSLDEYLIENKLYTIAVYGMGKIGMHLIKELRESSSVQVAYGIDKKVTETGSGIMVYTPNEFPGEVDAIIVSATFAYDEISAELKKRSSCPIISLEEILEVL